MFNWYTKLNAFLSPSIGWDSIGNLTNKPSASAVDIAAELAKLNPTLIKNTPRATAYKINPYTAQQLAQVNQQQGLLSAQNPQYQQYLAKMAGYGAGAGKTAPAATAPTTQGNSNG